VQPTKPFVKLKFTNILIPLVVIPLHAVCSHMDRSWINAIRTSDEYENGVKEFLEFAKTSALDSNGKCYYLCRIYLNERWLKVEEIREHVLCDGFCPSYTRWIWHGESLGMPSVFEIIEADKGMIDQVEDMIGDIGQ